MTDKRYDVINEAEPRGQSVTDNGIPCTARTCVTRLNILTEENERFKFILQEAIRTERTNIGKNVLKQLADNLGVKYE